MSMTFLSTISMLFLSYLFVTAGAKKFFDSRSFYKTIGDYRLLPGSWSKPVARLLPIVEMSVGIGLLIPALHFVSAVAACVALVAYSGAISLNMARGRRDLDCGCAGPGAEQLISGALVVRNAVLLILAIALVFNPPSQGVSLGSLGVCFALAGAMLCALIYEVINQLLANRDKLRRISNHG